MGYDLGAATGMRNSKIAASIFNETLNFLLQAKFKKSESIQDADPTICTLTIGGANASLTKNINVVFDTGYISHSLSLGEVEYANMFRLPTVTVKSNGNVSSTQSQVLPNWRFSTDAKDIIITLRRGSRFTLQVDGVFYSKDITIMPDPGSNDSPMLLEFADKRTRDIKINFSSSDSGFKGVSVLPTDSVWTTKTNSLKAVLVGDSFSTGTQPNVGGLSYPNILMNNLGIDNYMISGDGGTGFVNNQLDTKYNYLERVSDVIDVAPDIVFVSASVNDNGLTAELDANITAWHSAVRAALPDAIIIVLGAQGRADATTIAMEAQLLSTFNAIGDARLILVPITTSTAPMITGTGNQANLQNDGNADIYISSDNTHYNAAGHIFSGNVVASKVLDAVEAFKR